MINNKPTKIISLFIAPKTLITVALILIAILSNCTYVVCVRSACLYMQDLRDDPHGFLEWQFSMDKDKEFKDTCVNCHTVKITIDIDLWNVKFASRDSIPDEYFQIHHRDWREYGKKHAIFDLSRLNNSNRGEISRIEIMDDSLPIEIPFIDYKTYGWGSKNFHFKSNGFCTIPLRIIAETDTFVSSISIEKDSLVMQEMCHVERSQRKSISLNPLDWPIIIAASIKGRRLEREKN